MVYAWAVCELLFVTNAWQVSSKLRIHVLRLFGARVGQGVVFRQRTRVKFPWKLTVGDRSWIGEGVWIHNQDFVTIGNDVVVSQESFLTTGSHAHRSDMRLITSPIHIDDGVWITSRTMITGGVRIGKSALIGPMSLIQKSIPANSIYSGNPPVLVGERFRFKE
ncbi:acetyltransferase [Arthrobacter sp. A2-55]|nr:acetyltransferase [Arthrobacter sp. A2-55]